MTLLAYSARAVRMRSPAARGGIEGHVPGAGGVLDEGDLIGIAAQQLGGRLVEALDRRILALGRLVAADLGLEVR